MSGGRCSRGHAAAGTCREGGVVPGRTLVDGGCQPRWHGGTVLDGSTTQRPRLSTSYSKTKRRSSRTHRSLQLAKGIAEKKKRGGGANGVDELLNCGKSGKGGEEEG